jgi:hypothetical protein
MTPENNLHEIKSAESFLSKEASFRFVALCTASKDRKKFRRYLGQGLKLRDEAVVPILASKQVSDSIYSELVARGAPDECFLISESSRLDGEKMALKTALDIIIAGGFVSIISCIPGVLAFYEGEGLSNRCILHLVK